MAILEALPLAMAAKNSGGLVIAQVEHIAKTGTLHPKLVKVPGALVDYVYRQPPNHMQTQQTYFNPAFAGDIKVPVESIPPAPGCQKDHCPPRRHGAAPQFHCQPGSRHSHHCLRHRG